VAPTGEQAQQVSAAYSEGAAAYARGEFPAAATAFRRAYELYPAPAMAFNLARVYERMGESDQAIHFFEIVQHGNPAPSAEQLADIDRRIAGLRAYEQRRREGIAQTLPTTDALSQEGNTWFQRGVALYRRRNYRQALIAFEQAHQYLQTPELFYNLAVTYRALHDISHALEFMREYLDARRGTPEEAWIEQQVHALEAQR
jgi:tetratricopeptide (TPR) repeat protein